MRGPGGRAPLLGTPKDMPSKVLEMGACFHRDPVLGNMGGKGRSFPGAFERRVKFLFIRTFIEEWGLGWRSGYGTAQLVGGSRDRSPVTGDFFRGIRQFHMPWGRLSL